MKDREKSWAIGTVCFRVVRIDHSAVGGSSWVQVALYTRPLVRTTIGDLRQEDWL